MRLYSLGSPVNLIDAFSNLGRPVQGQESRSVRENGSLSLRECHAFIKTADPPYLLPETSDMSARISITRGHYSLFD
jgi:hypothetical protein